MIAAKFLCRTTMNDFGINAHVRASMTMFEEMSRSSGRTTDVCRAAKEGDLIVCASQADSRNVRTILREMGKDKIVEVTFRDVRQGFGRHGTHPTGVVLFDHPFVEGFWRHRVGEIAGELKAMQEAWSKYEHTVSEIKEFQQLARASKAMSRWDW